MYFAVENNVHRDCMSETVKKIAKSFWKVIELRVIEAKNATVYFCFYNYTLKTTL